jgi:sRNA-binding carbon storage regulator CsrA
MEDETETGWLVLGRKNEEELVFDVAGPCRIRVKPLQCVKGRCRIGTMASVELVKIHRAECLAEKAGAA